MKLTDLEPRWLAEPGRSGLGLSFLCPHCIAGEKKVRLAIAFANPIDGGEMLPLWGKGRRFSAALALDAQNDEVPGAPKTVEVIPGGVHWKREGDTFETLTLAPSVDASKAGHWHGHITAGAVRDS